MTKNGPLEILPSGFEVWKMDRTKGRYTFMTRADEDRLCAALRETFGNFQVISGSRISDTPEVKWRNSISAFPVTAAPPDFRYGVRIVEIHFPWPKWELRAEPSPYPSKCGVQEESKRSYTEYTVQNGSPLSIRIDRSQFLGSELMPGIPWRREALICGFIQTAWCSEGPYVEAQQAFVRKLFRLLGKLTTNRLRFLRFDKEERITLNETKKGYWCWAGEDALRWCREDERRLMIEHGAFERKTGHVIAGYRPLD